MEQAIAGAASDRGDRRSRPAISVGINYLAPMTTPPMASVDPALRRLDTEAHDMAIANAWAIADLSLDRQGVVAVKHASRYAGSDDMGDLVTGYPDELEELILRISGARWVIPVRKLIVKRSTAFRDKAGTAPASITAHADYSSGSLLQLAQMLQEEEASTRRFRRVGIYQTWRALSAPPQDRPMVFCDARTIADADYTPIKVYQYEREESDAMNSLEAVVGSFNPDHRWFYFPSLRADDLIVFRGADSDPDHHRNVLHTSVPDGSLGDEAIPRESVEVRFCCFYD